MQVDMWIDFINSTVVPAAQRVISQCNGLSKEKMDQRGFSIALGELKSALANIENHLKLRNFLVGHSLTLADALLINQLQNAFTLAVDKKTRESALPNITRYTTLILEMPVFQTVYGLVTFCKDANFSVTTKNE